MSMPDGKLRIAAFCTNAQLIEWVRVGFVGDFDVLFGGYTLHNRAGYVVGAVNRKAPLHEILSHIRTHGTVATLLPVSERRV